MRSITLLLAFVLALQQNGPAVGPIPPPAIQFDGLITPSGKVHISAPVDGLLETVTVDRGDLVEKGQLVATLQSDVEEATVKLAKARAEMVADLRRSEARLEYSASRLIEDEKLFQKGILPQQEYEEIKTTKLLDEAAVLAAKENIRFAEIEHERAVALLAQRRLFSPLTGVVAERFLSPGDLLTRQTDTRILEIVQISPLWVEVLLPVEELGKVSLRMQAEVRPEEAFGGMYTATVTVVDRVVNPGSGTFGVRLELPNPENRLPAGLKCRVRFVR